MLEAASLRLQSELCCGVRHFSANGRTVALHDVASAIREMKALEKREGDIEKAGESGDPDGNSLLECHAQVTEEQSATPRTSGSGQMAWSQT
jgi:hypothetical protein